MDSDPPSTQASPERRQRHRRSSDVESNIYSSPRRPRGPLSPQKSFGRDPIIRVTSPVEGPNDTVLSGASDIHRKRSLVRPERRKFDKNDPGYHYRKHAQKMDVQPSATGNDPALDDRDRAETDSTASTDAKTMTDEKSRGRATSRAADATNRLTKQPTRQSVVDQKKKQLPPQQAAPGVPSLWITYCYMVTFWAPGSILACFGKPQKVQQRAWREKIGLISIILLLATFVGFLTFGFTATVCPSTGVTRLRVNDVGLGYLIIHGQAYDLTHSQHIYARGVPDGANVLYLSGYPLGGYDASFMFQNVNGHCKGLITPAANSQIPHDDQGNMAWYMACNPYKQDGSSPTNYTYPYYFGYACHTSNFARSNYSTLRAASSVYYTWDDIRNSSRNLAVYGEDVIDLDLLTWLDPTQVSFPSRFDDIRNNPKVRGTDLTLAFTSPSDKQIAQCFTEIIKVGSVDTETIGCIASKVVLYVSLAFILSIVAAKFVLALIFQWFLCHKYAATKGVQKDVKKRNKEIEEWADDIYRAPAKIDDPFGGSSTDRSTRASTFLPTKSRFTSPYAVHGPLSKARPQPITMASQSSTARLIPGSSSGVFASNDSALTLPQSSRTSMMYSEKTGQRQSVYTDFEGPGPAGFIHESVVPQPPPEYQPFGYPLAHSICLVTAYSEGEDGLRTTFDSIATTDYPNSHKLLFVVCDGLIRGHGESMTTPEIVLGMMKDMTMLPEEVQAYSYVAVASGSKRHNMAKIYAGFYDYGEESDVPFEKQQRVPMLVVVKCGTPDEITKAKPGNRGKRDSQIILMSFLQKVMFDERMTELEYEMFNGIWKITGISPDFYEVCLCVDADTKVYPDCMTHMVNAMVRDPEIMGLCGETKIANKRDTWVTAIQVFEYFISHQQAKSFESVFGGVTCLPGCFSMYRIKAPKGGQNYWVPILANPDIVEHYSENVVDTLHKKNLLLLGEDRYLSTLMLRTFPKRKQVYVPQAICKTTVPDQFKVLLSQRRRWINSTIHNLMELVLVRDLCGTFCFSMQFVVFVELIGTCVLPAAISFTIYIIVDSIVAGIRHTPIPTISLVLLALILGLPGFLIVLTAKNWSYVMWMLIYLAALPIWNGVLPLYSYWKFDDFSWGDTRKTAGEKTKKAGLEYEGEFDSTKITMKRWGEFEQERRVKESVYAPRSSQAFPPSSYHGLH